MKTFLFFLTYLFLCVSDFQVFAQWEQLNIPGNPFPPIPLSMLEFGNYLYVGTDIGFFRSADDGITWEELTIGSLTHSGVSSITYNGNFLFVSAGENGVYRSSNGTSWERKIEGLVDADTSRVFILYSVGTNVFAGTGVYTNESEAIYISQDNGDSWEPRNSGINALHKECHMIYETNNLLFCSITAQFPVFHLTFRSNDLGVNWEQITQGGMGGLGLSSDMENFNNKQYSAFATLYYSTDFGNSWVKADSGLGAHPSKLSSGHNKLFCIAGFSELYIKSDSEDTWELFMDGMGSGVEVYEIYVGNNYVFAGTYEDNLWRYPLSILSVEEISTEEPVSNFELEQNYPNPFNPSTNIKFALPQTFFITLEIFNSLGERVSILVSQELNAGTYNYDWNASNLTSGIYFYKLQAGNLNETKKMILLK